MSARSQRPALRLLGGDGCTVVRMDDRLCLLVIIGVTEQGHKELIAGEDGQRESAMSWSELLTGLRERGLTQRAKLAVSDGALGFWKAVA